mmetsp:Transcript_38015/g.60096  ORF Transcript_38015/g.60096 Transcript_38015/m.60096 type:complete len:176 (-) Transcript_38015:524-1051(-)|eukprot:CAMPEP_0201526400 /NCGR_PEP_ID=MMETSP0161_2-20130828/31744_1 /ASSEMBLY_ACC=CAM_ASM_000251 /TAXON_ID=180227 /ORGANISM="Neoparamoeba aestuarina, Strain SoJaBio B1-5/56/2" /LENGTH=175 /DNA_ID=CAMNT_0047926781 /DNA_START=112 /DNA_END=639 /DNA_ORIENTATION=-
MSSSNFAKHLNKAKEFKEEGNKLFKENEFGKAMFQYHMGIMELKAIFSQLESSGLINQAAPKTADEETIALFVTLNSNLGMCSLKEGRPERCVKSCSEALKKDPNHQKSLYRRGKAYMEPSTDTHTRDLMKAREDLEAAQKLSPNDKPTQTLIQRLEKMEAKEQKEMQKTYQKMF